MSMEFGSSPASDTRRRLIVFGAGCSALAWSGVARAQPPMVIGWLSPGSREANTKSLNAFHEGMAALGWKVSAQYVIDEHWADGQLNRLPSLAQALAARKPAIIVVNTAATAGLMAKAAPATPVVMTGGEPLTSGLVKSLARPGGMITGLSNVNTEIIDKLIELLVESMPKLRRIGFFADASNPSYGVNVKIVRRAAERYRFEASIADVVKPEDIEPAIARLTKDKVQALVLLSTSWLQVHRQQIVKLALAQRWPLICNSNNFTEAGALFNYGANSAEGYRRVAYFVDRILKGTKPGDLPIEQPTVFEMVLNLKTAKALGITFPQSILVRATKVIE